MGQEATEVTDRRKLLHLELVALGTQAVHFQPPPSVKLIYPCIVYRRKSTDSIAADNRNYKNQTLYQIEVIDPNPDTPYVSSLLNSFSMIKHVNNFKSDNLNHDVFDLYY